MSEQYTQVLIIGGGAIGCSIAYHLTLLGIKDVVLLEKQTLTHGATWHAAGLVGQLRNKRNLTRLMQYSAQLYDELEEKTGQATDWHRVGSLRVASSPERWEEIKRTATTAQSFGFEIDLVGPHEAQALFPLMRIDDVIGAAWIPGDGYIDPSSLTQAYAKGAKQGGAKIIEGTTVSEIIVENRQVSKVVTENGDSWYCETLVNAAGLWAREVGELAGVKVPAGVVEHQYLVTEKSDSVRSGLPTFRDPDKLFYVKPDVACLALGGWEPDTVPFAQRGMPSGFARELLTSNFDRFEQILLQAAERIPIFNELGIQTLINGPIPVSPDGEPIMGPVPELRNFFVACGFTAGIAGSGGAGKTMAEWIVHGEPEYDVWAFDIRRFGAHHSSPDFLASRAVENYAHYYLIHWPGEEPESGRELRTSPLYEDLKKQGAVFGSKFGWERPNWFVPNNHSSRGLGEKSFDRSRTDSFYLIGEEHQAVRNRVALIDQSSFAKLEVTGPGAINALQLLTVSNIDRPVGSVIYTQMCNKHGGIECDLTLMRTQTNRYYIVTGSGFGIHDFQWIESNLPQDDSVFSREITGQWAVINICGPQARKVLERVCNEDISNSAFPFSTCQYIDIHGARILAARIGYVGELGWELHIPTEFARHVYHKLKSAGQDFGIVDVGYRAIDSLRMEKGYLYWSSDITPDYNPFEAGLGWRVHLKSKSDFIGRKVLQKYKQNTPSRILGTFTIQNAPPVFYGGECIYIGGRVQGTTSSANWGYTTGCNIAYGYVEAEAINSDNIEIEAFGVRYSASLHRDPLYDPTMLRLKS